MMKAKLDMGILGSTGIPDLYFDALVQVSSPQSQHRDAHGHVFLKADSVYILAEIGGWEVVVGVDHQCWDLGSSDSGAPCYLKLSRLSDSTSAFLRLVTSLTSSVYLFPLLVSHLEDKYTVAARVIILQENCFQH